MTHGSLFSGIGGFDLAAHWAGIENVFACEIDEFCRKVLNKRFPNTTLYQDIKETNFEQYSGTVDIISGGFPCQPFSVAGKRAGTEDNRYLWGEMLRVVREVQPRWIIAENVRGLTNIAGGSTFETVCDDLEISGYEVQPFIIPALSVGAPHKRERVWIIAHATTDRRTKGKYECGNISEQIQKAPKRKFSGTVSLFDATFADSNDNQQEQPKCDNETGITPSITPDRNSIRESQPERIDKNEWRRTLNSCGKYVTSITPDPESLRHGRRGNGHDCDDRERFIRQDKQDDRNEIRGETTSSNEFDTANTDNGCGNQNEIQARGKVNDVCHTREWDELWTEAITRIYGMDDGLPGGMDRLEQRYKHKSRRERIKTMGNSIVPQIAYQIFKAILEAENN